MAALLYEQEQQQATSCRVVLKDWYAGAGAHDGNRMQTKRYELVLL